MNAVTDASRDHRERLQTQGRALAQAWWILILCFTGTAWAQDDKPVLKPEGVATENPRAVEALKSVCSASLEKQSVNQNQVALCLAKCPAGTDYKGDESQWAVGVTFGHFLSPASESAVIAVTGCESHAKNFGGSYLLERSGGAWKTVWYEGGLITDECHKIAAPDGRELLVCHLNDSHQGFRESILYLVDLKSPKKENSNLFMTVDNLEVCDSEAVRASIDRVEFTASGMKIYARHGKMAMTPKQIKDCKADRLPSVATKPYTIQFTFDGDTYRVDAGSRDAARLFEVR
jgi:hypothetical protein